MKLLASGDTAAAICDRDGMVMASYQYRDVPFSEGHGLAKDILAGVCPACDRVIITPPQSTPAIHRARREALRSMEFSLPAPFADILDAAAYRIDGNATTEFLKGSYGEYCRSMGSMGNCYSPFDYYTNPARAVSV